MKTTSRLLTTIILLAMAGTSCAQQSVELQRPKKEQQSVELQRSKKEVVYAEDELQKARTRLEQAAREVAELSGRHGMNFILNHDFNAKRAMIGINIGGRLDDGSSEGVEVLGVTPESPAGKAGLKAGDVILKIDDELLSADSSAGSSEKLTVYLAGKEPGDTVNVEYIRGGKTSSVAVETMAMQPMAFARRITAPRSPAAPGNNFTHIPVPMGTPHGMNFVAMVQPWADMELAELTEGLGKYFGTDTGVLVVKAPEDDTLQLEDGDVILNIDGRVPNDPVHALRIIGSYDSGEEMDLQIMRDKRRRKLEVKLPENIYMPEQYKDFPDPADDAAFIIRHPAPAAVMAAPAVPLQPGHNPESITIIKRLHEPGI